VDKSYYRRLWGESSFAYFEAVGGWHLHHLECGHLITLHRHPAPSKRVLLVCPRQRHQLGVPENSEQQTTNNGNKHKPCEASDRSLRSRARKYQHSELAYRSSSSSWPREGSSYPYIASAYSLGNRTGTGISQLKLKLHYQAQKSQTNSAGASVCDCDSPGVNRSAEHFINFRLCDKILKLCRFKYV
jgi:hypothetical protein